MHACCESRSFSLENQDCQRKWGNVCPKHAILLRIFLFPFILEDLYPKEEKLYLRWDKNWQKRSSCKAWLEKKSLLFWFFRHSLKQISLKREKVLLVNSVLTSFGWFVTCFYHLIQRLDGIVRGSKERSLVPVEEATHLEIPQLCFPKFFFAFPSFPCILWDVLASLFCLQRRTGLTDPLLCLTFILNKGQEKLQEESVKNPRNERTTLVLPFCQLFLSFSLLFLLKTTRNHASQESLYSIFILETLVRVSTHSVY